MVDDVPAPLVQAGSVLVEVAYSLISTGTELTGVAQSDQSLIQRAIDRPDRVQKLVGYLREKGIKKTFAKLRGELDFGQPTGYSCAGRVVQVGSGVTDLQPGARVACAGAGKAVHAELVIVPRNLVVRVPDGCELKDAASVTLGAIAMQGVRRADPRLGEMVAVSGLGLLGLITVQLLRAAGCRVIGFDPEHRRAELAKQLGADHAFDPMDAGIPGEIRHLTGNHGVDATIITAASESDAIVQQAMEITRKKGRVVIVGAVGLGLRRAPFYEKEIDLLISCSYGPGRYDSRYEERGIDYPFAYVRWTENRNMQEYLRLISSGQMRLEPILEREYELAQASQAYEELRTAATKPLGVLLRYPFSDDEVAGTKLATNVVLSTRRVKGKIRVAIVGAGGFARSVHMPNLQKLADLYHLRTVVDATGDKASAAAQEFGADCASTNFDDVLGDADIDMVIICTRHNLHADLTERAAKAGKAILLEKPMAMNEEELDRLAAVLKETGVPFSVGFNRRFSPAARHVRRILEGRQSPLMIHYRVNAGYLPRDHWTQTHEGGGRIIGEACHMFDLFQYLVSPAKMTEIISTPIVPQVEHVFATDNVVTTVSYEDGSVATLLYTALGAKDFPKEYVEIYADGKVMIIDDYRTLRVFGASDPGWTGSAQDKGHLRELEAFARWMRGETGPPIPLDDLVEVSRVSLVAAGVGNSTIRSHEG